MKLSQVAGIFYKLRKLVSLETLKLLYHGLAGSKLRYGLICWATCNRTLLNQVNVAHNNIITIMSFSKRCSRLWPLYCQLKLLPLDILIDIEYGKTMYKFQNKHLPQVFDSYFKKPSHHHATRYATSNNNYEVIRTTTATDKLRLQYIGTKAWASIPINIKTSMSLKVFIKSYRNFLIGHYAESL